MHFSNKTLANTLKDAGCQIFLNVLDQIDGVKDLVLSETILVQLDSITGMQKLRQNAVDKVYKLQADTQFSDTKNRVYVIRPSIEEVKLVADQINHYLTRGDDRCDVAVDVKFWIIFVPKLFHYCDLALEEEGVYEYVTKLECPLGLIPLEYDVYSLEDDRIFRSFYLMKDLTSLTDIVNSIQQLQLLSGKFTEVHCQGRYSELIAKKLDESNLKYVHNLNRQAALADKNINDTNDAIHNLKSNYKKMGLKEQESEEDDDGTPSFTDIYLFDRDSDFASVLLSEITYEGILDECFNICCNKLEFTVETSNKQTVTNNNKRNNNDNNNINTENANENNKRETITIRHSLSRETDPVYRHIRDNHFSTVFSLVKTKGQEMKQKYASSQDMNISNLKNFVANELKTLQVEIKALDIHLSACEEIMKQKTKYDFSDQLMNEQHILHGVELKRCLEYITKVITLKQSPYVPLRLLALLSLMQGGLLPRDYRKFHSLYCEKFGLFNNATFVNLKKLGLISEIDLSLNALTGRLINSYSSSNNDTNNTTTPSSSNDTTTTTSGVSSSSSSNYSISKTSRASTNRFASSLSGAMSSFTERASGRMVAAVLPRTGNLAQVIKKFQLIPEVNEVGYNLREPRDPAFVFNGSYIPLVCQLLNKIILAKQRTTITTTTTSTTASTTPTSTSSMNNGPERSLLLYFIGGVTFAEISALRFVARQRNIKIAIATTSIINGNKLIDSLFPVDRIHGT